MLGSVKTLKKVHREYELDQNSRVGGHEITLLLLSFGPVLEWTLSEVNTGDSLRYDVGAESSAV